MTEPRTASKQGHRGGCLLAGSRGQVPAAAASSPSSRPPRDRSPARRPRRPLQIESEMSTFNWRAALQIGVAHNPPSSCEVLRVVFDDSENVHFQALEPTPGLEPGTP